MALDYIILVIFALLMIGIAFYTKKSAKSTNDFLLAGKKGLNGWMSAFSYGTTYFSSVVFIGYAGQFGRSLGLASIWIGVGNAIFGTLIAWLVLAKRTKNMTRRLDAKTMPDFFAKRYGDSLLKYFSAIIIFIFLIPYSASVYSGISSLFELVLGIPGWIIMIALALLTAIYLSFGGYIATSISDFIQGIVMLVGVICMVVCFMCNENINWDISELINNPKLSWFTFGAEGSGGLYGTTVSLISLIILTSFGVWALPQTVHKYYSVRDKKAIVQGMIVSTGFALIIGFVAYFTGALSFFFEKTWNLSDALVVPTMIKLAVPVGLSGLIATLILSASMSTLASVSLASASVISVDLYKGGINKGASDGKVNILMKILSFSFVILSVVLALLNEKFNITAIAYLMGISWGTLAGCFIGPFVLGLIWKKVTRSAVWTSIIGSLVLTVTLIFVFGIDKTADGASLAEIIKAGIGTSPLIGVLCMVFSLLSTFLVSLFTKKPDAQVIESAFDKHFEGEIV